MPAGSLRASGGDLDGVFRAGSRKGGVRSRVSVRVQRRRERCLRFRHAFTAAGANTEFAGEVPQSVRAAFHCGSNMPVRDCFTDANDHSAIVNANTNDCQYYSILPNVLLPAARLC